MGAANIFAISAINPLSLVPRSGDWERLVSADWRHEVAKLYLGSFSDLVVRPLQEGLELWEAAPVGYLLVDTDTPAVLEYSEVSHSPLIQAEGDLYYLGLGAWVVDGQTGCRNALSGQRLNRAEVRSMAPDSAAMFRELADQDARVSALRRGAVSQEITLATTTTDTRVTSFGFITGSHVYPNSDNICGWVAGSILVRYWYARFTSRNLLPSSYRSGTNLTPSPNFATFLRGSSGNTSWARDVRDRLRWLISRQGVNAQSTYLLGNLGIESEIFSNRPVILFGQLPRVSGSGTSAHAVVVYGLASRGYIAHYGYAGRTNVVINSGLAGSTTRFRYT